MNASYPSLSNKKIIVTGGTGSIGSEIVRQLLELPVKQVRIFSRDEHKQFLLNQEFGDDPRIRLLLGDVRDPERLLRAFGDAQVCFHAAALKHVPSCEYNPFEAVKTNVIGTQNVIDAAIACNLERVVGISSDKAVNPESVLGASKLMMERLLLAAHNITGNSTTRFSIVRFGNVIDSRGSVLPLWREQLAQNKKITITDPRMDRFFMKISEAASLVLHAAEEMKGNEIFVLRMKKFNLSALAKELLDEHKKDPKEWIRIIGMRPGEKLTEDLLTQDELRRAIITEQMYIVNPEMPIDKTPKEKPLK